MLSVCFTLFGNRNLLKYHDISRECVRDWQNEFPADRNNICSHAGVGFPSSETEAR